MRDQVLVGLVASMPGKRVLGKKSFQKLVYFLQRRGLDLGFKYGLHFYGPYSFDLAEYVRSLEMSAVLTLTDAGRSVEISLGPSGTDLLEPAQQKTPPGHKNVIQSVARELGGKSAMQLELLATVDFLAVNARSSVIRVDQLQAWVDSAKHGKFDPGDIGNAADELVNLGFLSEADPFPQV